MSLLSPKKLILLGFAVILLIAIPLTVYLVQKQQETRGRATRSTTLSIEPSTASTTVGQTISFDIMVDPGGINIVTLATLIINYEPDKLTTAAGFVPNITGCTDPGHPGLFCRVLQEPIYSSGSISAVLAISPLDPPIQTRTKIATITFQAQSITNPGTTTPITFGDETQVRSSGDNESFSDNVLYQTIPANVTITAGTAISPTPTPTTSVINPTVTPTRTPTPTTIVIQPTNQAPSCTALTLDQAATGTAPYTLTFTAVGNDTDGTINKVNFSFGDGLSQDETQAGGIGTNAVNIITSHTYNNAGTFTATATLTDDGGTVSNATTCTQNITVSSAIAVVPTTPPQPPPVIYTPIPTVPPTGPRETIIGIGAVGIVLTIIGGLFLFIL